LVGQSENYLPNKMQEIKFLSLDYIEKTVIPTIHKHYVRQDNPAHDYLKEPGGMQQVEGCLERIKWSYVEGLVAKATQLFLCINKGHYFGNGNKRLALVTLLSFLSENGCDFRDEYGKDKFSEFLIDLFPEFDAFEDEHDFSSIEFAYYNLTIIVADGNNYKCSHDQLKEKVEAFLRYSVTVQEVV